MKIFLLIILVVAMVSGSCSNAPEQIAVQASPTIQDNSAVPPVLTYPNPQILPNSDDQMYPVPAENIFYSDDNLPQAPDMVPDPEPGKASLSGVLYSFTTNIIIPHTNFYLRQAIGDENNSLPPVLYGPQDSDFIGTSNEKGEVLLNDVPPGSYFFVVESPPYSWAVVLNSNDDQNPKLFVFESGQSYNAGIMFLSWP